MGTTKTAKLNTFEQFTLEQVRNAGASGIPLNSLVTPGCVERLKKLGLVKTSGPSTVNPWALRMVRLA